MTTARAMIAEVSRYLTDQEEGFEFTHWTELDLFTYLRYSIAIIAAANKSKYSATKEIELTQGNLQTLSSICDNAQIIGTKTSSGAVVPARKITKDPSLSIDRPVCESTSIGKEYIVRTWSALDADSNTLWVSPEVPADVKVTVIASCFEPPVPTSMDETINLPTELEPALFEFMLYYAFGVDIESVGMRERSESHFNKAYTILGVALTAADTRKQTK